MRQTALRSRGGCGGGPGRGFRWGRGFVLRASDNVLIFISCY